MCAMSIYTINLINQIFLVSIGTIEKLTGKIVLSKTLQFYKVPIRLTT